MKRGMSKDKSKLFSYQSGAAYQPPVHFAADQTKSLENTTQTFYQTDETAARILDQMQGQRGQIKNAHGNVSDMRNATDKAKREMKELQQKYREKKQRLYAWIVILGFADILCLFRLFQCHGNFYC